MNNQEQTGNGCAVMAADEAWVRQNMGDIDLDGMELPEFFTAELKGEEEE